MEVFGVFIPPTGLTGVVIGLIALIRVEQLRRTLKQNGILDGNYKEE